MKKILPDISISKTESILLAEFLRPSTAILMLQPHWLVYFQVADVEAATAKVAQLGGKVLMPPRKMENVGTWSIVADPQGAVFSLFKSAR